MKTPQTWVTFLGDGCSHTPPLPEGARINRYKVQSTTGNAGMMPGWHVARIESDARIEADAPVVLHGVVQHLHYTTTDERSDLTTRSRTELPASAETVAVLIPIRKSAAWWQLAADQRGTHFHNTHTPIGAGYVEKIFRKLYHSRYTGSAHDFLTYFEFPASETNTFRALLAELRDTAKNPEWAYVEDEHEVWMTKIE